MRILVLGAGVVGTACAWHLQKDGHEVTVVDRQPAAGLETSFANGGQISVSHAEPWANPHVLPKALKWLGREDAPLLFRLRCDPALLAWSLRFLGECRPQRTRENVRAIVSLALYSRRLLGELRAETGIAYDQLCRGILHFYTDRREFAAACEAAALMREFGCERRVVDGDECLRIEPALAAVRTRLAGGDYTAADESGDAHKFTQALACLAAAHGVRFRFATAIERLLVDGDAFLAALTTRGEAIAADACVVACASHTPRLLAPLGARLPIYPAKGYSATFALAADSIAPTVSLTDDGHKLVFSRLGDRLRVAGTAEFNGFDTTLNAARCAALLRRTRELFPGLREQGDPQYWCGLRPATPSNVPAIGRVARRNLWVCSGHGTLGWTMACGSGAALADLIAGRRPEPDFPFLS